LLRTQPTPIAHSNRPDAAHAPTRAAPRSRHAGNAQSSVSLFLMLMQETMDREEGTRPSSVRTAAQPPAPADLLPRGARKPDCPPALEVGHTGRARPFSRPAIPDKNAPSAEAPRPRTVQQPQRTVAEPDPEAVSRARVLCPSPPPPEPEARLERLSPASEYNEKTSCETDRPSPARPQPGAWNPLFAVPSASYQVLPAGPAEISPPGRPSRQAAPPTPRGDAPRRVATMPCANDGDDRAAFASPHAGDPSFEPTPPARPTAPESLVDAGQDNREQRFLPSKANVRRGHKPEVEAPPAEVLDASTPMPVFSPLPVPSPAGDAARHRPEDGRPYAAAPGIWQRPEAPGTAPSPPRTTSRGGSTHQETPRASDVEIPPAADARLLDAARLPLEREPPRVGADAANTAQRSSAHAVGTDRPVAGAGQAVGPVAAVVTMSPGRMAEHPVRGGTEPDGNIPPMRPMPGDARPGERHTAQPAHSEGRVASTGQPSRTRRDHEADDLLAHVVPVVGRAVEAWVATQTSAPPGWRSDAIRLTSGFEPSLAFEGAFGETIRIVRDGVVEGRIGQDGAGTVRVTAEQADHGLRIVVHLDDRWMAAELEAQRPKLMQALQARGLSVAGVQIVGGPVRGTGFAARRSGPLDSPEDDMSDRVEGRTEAESEQDEHHSAERLSFRA